MNVFVVDEIGTIVPVVETVLTDFELIEVDILVDANGFAVLEVTASVEIDFSVVDVFAESCVDGVVDAGRELTDVVGRLVNLGGDNETDGEMMSGF